MFVCVGVWAPGAAAQQSDDVIREASKRFRRGVELYGEANYREALVEFRSAYQLAPSVTALYNVGQTQDQLQDYAGALKTFGRFLAEAPRNDSHRVEVESTVQVLRTRVGRVRITTVPEGAEVRVDDQMLGDTPFDEPLVMSVGRRKLDATIVGRVPVERYIEVAADAQLSVTLELPVAADSSPAAGQTPAQQPAEGIMAPRPDGTSTLRTIGWVATGALAAGASTFALLAVHSRNDLHSARNVFPAMSERLNHDADTTAIYSALADSLAITAVIAAGMAVYWTLSSNSIDGARRSTPPATRVSIGPLSARFETAF